jgi:hypothetical protein
MLDIIIRTVPNYGYLPIITVDGEEKYRGEFKSTAALALSAAEAMLEKLV